MDERFDYFAFISYSTRDLKYAWELKKQLEDYKLSKNLCLDGEPRKPIKKVFLDKTNIQVGDLDETLKAALDGSQYLIVVCSPNSAESPYVAKEIRWFTRNGNEDKVFKFIIDSDPANINACFSPALLDIEKTTGKELLGANINEKGVNKMFWVYRLPVLGPRLMFRRAVNQLVAPLIGKDFAQLWPYQKLLLKQRMAYWVFGLIVVLACMACLRALSQPFDSRVTLNEVSAHNDQLPPLHDAVITLTLDNEEKADTLQGMDAKALFANIPHHFLGETVRITFDAQDFLPVDTTVALSREVTLNIKRNPEVYGHVKFGLWDERVGAFIPGSPVTVAGHDAVSNAQGRVELFMPLEEQCTAYVVKTVFPVEKDTITMPCGENDALVRKYPD